MNIMWFFSKKGELTGTVEATALPPHFGHLMFLTLFRVKGAHAPPPFPDVAPPKAHKDETKLAQEVHFDKEIAAGSLAVNFQVLKPVGWYYLQLGFTLFRKDDKGMVAQVEQFPFWKRPVEIPVGGQDIVLPVSWPETPIGELEHYGTMRPGGRGRFC